MSADKSKPFLPLAGCADDGYTTKDGDELLSSIYPGFDPHLTVIVDGVRPAHLKCRMILVTSPPLEIAKVSAEAEHLFGH